MEGRLIPESILIALSYWQYLIDLNNKVKQFDCVKLI